MRIVNTDNTGVVPNYRLVQYGTSLGGTEQRCEGTWNGAAPYLDFVSKLDKLNYPSLQRFRSTRVVIPPRPVAATTVARVIMVAFMIRLLLLCSCGLVVGFCSLALWYRFCYKC